MELKYLQSPAAHSQARLPSHTSGVRSGLYPPHPAPGGAADGPGSLLPRRAGRRELSTQQRRGSAQTAAEGGCGSSRQAGLCPRAAASAWELPVENGGPHWLCPDPSSAHPPLAGGGDESAGSQGGEARSALKSHDVTDENHNGRLNSTQQGARTACPRAFSGATGPRRTRVCTHTHTHS